jgi:hypothetical protein
MKCEHFLETILDKAAGVTSHSEEFEAHLRICGGCSVKFHDLRRTLNLLDEWRCPEPSVRFDSRLRARLLEEKGYEKTFRWSLFSRPVLAMGLATLLFAIIVVTRSTTRLPLPVPTRESELEALPGTAVGDLEMLEEVDNLSKVSDLLDLLAPEQPDVTH